MAVFSGPYIYFYPGELEDRINEMCRYHNSRAQARKAGTDIEPRKQNEFKDVNHEEAYLLKGCNDVQLYSDYLSGVRGGSAQEGLNSNAQNSLMLKNSSNVECVIELFTVESRDAWRSLIMAQA